MASIKRTIKFILATTVVIVFLAFSVDNREAVTISFFPLPYSADMPKFLFAIACFILGALTGGIVASLGLYQITRQHKMAQRRIMALENEIKAQQQEKLPAVSK